MLKPSEYEGRAIGARQRAPLHTGRQHPGECHRVAQIEHVDQFFRGCASVVEIGSGEDEIIDLESAVAVDFTAGQGVQACGFPQIRPLYETGIHHLLEPLLLHRPAFEHAVRRHNIGLAGLARDARGNGTVLTPDAMNMDAIRGFHQVAQLSF